MNTIAIALKHLIAAGVTGDALVTAIAEIEQSLTPVRSNAAIKQQRYRDKLRNEGNEGNALPNVTENEKNSSAHIENAGAPDSLILNLKKERKITGSRFSLTSLPPEWKSFCQAKRPDLNPEETFDAFMDWWIAQPGSKGVKLDWFATWRTWVRSQRKLTGAYNAKQPEPRKSNVHTL